MLLVFNKNSLMVIEKNLKFFENIANKIFDNKQQQFSQSSKSLLETTLDPFKLQLSDFRKKVEDVYEKENADRNRLSGQVLELQKRKLLRKIFALLV